MIELAILGLLKEKDRHGYDLKKQLLLTMGPSSNISFGSLYPALARLEKNGSVHAVEGKALLPVIPMTGALSGEIAAFKSRLLQTKEPLANRRGKKVYAITEKGHELFESLILDHNEEDRHFDVKVIFCRYLTPQQRVELFEHRRLHVQKQISQRKKQQMQTMTVDTYTQSLYAYDTKILIQNLAWIDELLTHARSEIIQPSTTQQPILQGESA